MKNNMTENITCVTLLHYNLGKFEKNFLSTMVTFKKYDLPIKCKMKESFVFNRRNFRKVNIFHGAKALIFMVLQPKSIFPYSEITSKNVYHKFRCFLPTLVGQPFI